MTFNLVSLIITGKYSVGVYVGVCGTYTSQAPMQSGFFACSVGVYVIFDFYIYFLLSLLTSEI